MMRARVFRFAVALLMFTNFSSLYADEPALPDSALAALGKGVASFHSINAHGGYVYYVTPDLSRRWGESPANEHTIEVQPPGTPAVGLAFLKVYQTTGNERALQAARDAAYALIRGQNDLGGWEHTIRFNRPKGNSISFDDDQTQTAISFLMALDQVIDDDSLTMAINKALDMMLEAQLDNGGWPHKYPRGGSYHDFATFNDEGINDCIRVMLQADRYYNKKEYRAGLRKVGRFLKISQLPPPQPGWAQQYNEYLQPAWARTFEPPSVCPLVTVNNIISLIDLYLYTFDGSYLEPIPDAIRWLEDIRLPNGKWARFVELYTNKPLYYDRGRIRVNSTAELSLERRTGYGYEVDLFERLLAAKARYQEVIDLGADGYLKKENTRPSQSSIKKRLAALAPQVRRILAAQDEQGRWLTKNDRFKKHTPGKRWNGEYEVMDRISSRVFINNINVLCEFVRLAQYPAAKE